MINWHGLNLQILTICSAYLIAGSVAAGYVMAIIAVMLFFGLSAKDNNV